jgi:Uma2 family endonuclease
MSSSQTKFSLQEFLDLPESGDSASAHAGLRSELIDGEIVPNVFPTSLSTRHSFIALLTQSVY